MSAAARHGRFWTSGYARASAVLVPEAMNCAAPGSAPRLLDPAQLDHHNRFSPVPLLSQKLPSLKISKV